jgi:hypothetical protein
MKSALEDRITALIDFKIDCVTIRMIFLCIIFLSFNNLNCTPKLDYKSPKSVVAKFCCALVKKDFAEARQYCTESFNRNELDIIYRYIQTEPQFFCSIEIYLPRDEKEYKEMLKSASEEFTTRIDGDNAVVTLPGEKSMSFELVKLAGEWKINKCPPLSQAVERTPGYL